MGQPALAPQCRELPEEPSRVGGGTGVAVVAAGQADRERARSALDSWKEFRRQRPQPLAFDRGARHVLVGTLEQLQAGARDGVRQRRVDSHAVRAHGDHAFGEREHQRARDRTGLGPEQPRLHAVKDPAPVGALEQAAVPAERLERLDAQLRQDVKRTDVPAPLDSSATSKWVSAVELDVRRLPAAGELARERQRGLTVPASRAAGCPACWRNGSTARIASPPPPRRSSWWTRPRSPAR